MIDTDYERYTNLYDFYITKGVPPYTTTYEPMLEKFIEYEEYEKCSVVKRWIEQQNETNKIWNYTGE